MLEDLLESICASFRSSAPGSKVVPLPIIPYGMLAGRGKLEPAAGLNSVSAESEVPVWVTLSPKDSV